MFIRYNIVTINDNIIELYQFMTEPVLHIKLFS